LFAGGAGAGGGATSTSTSSSRSGSSLARGALPGGTLALAAPSLARGISLSIDTKAAAAANHGNAWAGVRLKNPHAARLRKTKEASSPDSPTVAKLVGAAQLGVRGLLLEVKRR
jgi:hypothetical protein